MPRVMDRYRYEEWLSEDHPGRRTAIARHIRMFKFEVGDVVRVNFDTFRAGEIGVISGIYGTYPYFAVTFIDGAVEECHRIYMTKVG